MCFSSQTARNSRRPQVRQSDQSHQAAGSTGCSDHWTGSSVSVFPLDMTSVQLPAGKQHTHTGSQHKHPVKKGGCRENGKRASSQSILNLNFHFGWFLLSSAGAQRDIIKRSGGDDWQGRAEEHSILRLFLISCQLYFYTPYIILSALCPTSGSTEWLHPSSTYSKSHELFL